MGDKVLILDPAYVAGKTGVIFSQELLSDGSPSDRWLIQVNGENIIVSLTLHEFRVIHHHKE